MKLTLQPKKIPVYLHIPKNAGTYSIHVFTKYFIRLVKNASDLHVQRLTVLGDNFNLTVFVKFNSDSWKTDKNIKEHDFPAARARKCELSTLKTYIKNKQLTLLSIVVEPVGDLDLRRGIFLANDLIDMVNGEALHFTILRDCFSRQQSLYYYLNGNESSHEPTHGGIKENTFSEYLSSYSLEDSWLIRVLTGMPITTKINKHWLRIVTDFLDSYDFIIGDISKTDDILNYVVHKCFGIKIEDSDTERPHYNSTKIENKITIQDLDEETKQKFLERTYWDRKLWERYKDRF